MIGRRTFALTLLPVLALSGTVNPTGALAQGLPNETAAAYCTNLADAAADARFALKLARLREAESAIEERLAALEAKRAEYEDWLSKREQFLSLAEDGLVAIYSGMRPDAASEQLAEMDEITAAAVLAKVQPRIASAILNEMRAPKAARLATIVAGMSRNEEARS